MWLFTGRYRELGAAICLISFVVASFGSTFLVVAIQLARRPKLSIGKIVGVLLAVISVGFIGEGLGSAEQVFIPPNSLNQGIALFAAIIGTSFGLVGIILGMVLRNRARLLRLLFLGVAAGMLLGDLAGWLERSHGLDKYDSPAGMLRAPKLAETG
jgi:hypothetical protein